jgi:hypothetical protein
VDIPALFKVLSCFGFILALSRFSLHLSLSLMWGRRFSGCEWYGGRSLSLPSGSPGELSKSRGELSGGGGGPVASGRRATLLVRC